MLIPLLILLTAAQVGEPEGWRPLESPEEPGVSSAWRPAADDAGGGDARRTVMRVTAPGRAWTTAEMDVEYACAGQTWTMLGVRALDADGAVMRSVMATAEQLRPEPLYAGDTGYAQIYVELCPGAAPLPERPVHAPPVAVGPRGG